MAAMAKDLPVGGMPESLPAASPGGHSGCDLVTLGDQVIDTDVQVREVGSETADHQLEAGQTRRQSRHEGVIH